MDRGHCNPVFPAGLDYLQVVFELLTRTGDLSDRDRRVVVHRDREALSLSFPFKIPEESGWSD